MKLQRHAVFPLSIRHLKQVDLWNSPSDIEQSIDSAKTFESRLDKNLGRLRLAQVERIDQRLRACHIDCGRRSLQLILISRCKYYSRKIARQPQCGGTSNSLTRTSDNSNGLCFHKTTS